VTPADVRALWDFGDPAGSEERFRAALAGAAGDDALILRTQIARTRGLRRDFAGARSLLAELEPGLGEAGPAARAWHALELGRTWSSAAHEPGSQTHEARAAAREAYERCLAIAREAALDPLAIDALHMLAFVDMAPEDGIHCADAGLEIALASSDPAARRWEATLRNNRGVALAELGRHDEALAEYERALALEFERGEEERIRIARWMAASALRHLGRLDEALAIQRSLEQECAAAGEPDPYVYEELEHLHRALGDDEQAERYAALHAAVASG
jgi:tetratricopeptide (TPR) repeat protein